MKDSLYLIMAFLTMGAISFVIRAIPFIASGWLKKQQWVKSLGDFLPLAVMVVLTLASAAGNAAGHDGFPWQEIASIGCTVILQWVWRNALISIFAGTALYVVLRNAGALGVM